MLDTVRERLNTIDQQDVTVLAGFRAALKADGESADPVWGEESRAEEIEWCAVKERKIKEKIKHDGRLYVRAFRSIAWGPTIVINVILSLFWI